MSDSGEDSVDDLADRLAALALEAERNTPPGNYRCGVCKEVGQHFINDCPEAARTGQRTPYQGKRRTFGKYQCKKCLGPWSSSRSWANTPQECQVCRIHIYPHVQTKLLRSKGQKDDEEDTEHKSGLCGKCQQLGHACVSRSACRQDQP